MSDVKTCAIISNNVCKKANIHKNKKRQCFYTGSEIKMRTDIIIVGSGCAGMYCALNLPKNKDILIITKDIVEHSDSFLAQGGMCML